MTNSPHSFEICGLCGESSRFALKAYDRPFYFCDNCELIFVPRHLHLSPEDQAARYGMHENTMENAGYVARFANLISQIKTHAPDVRRILDYGCGPGPVLVDLLRRAGYKAAGYDPYFASETDLSSPFDAVVSTETIEHFSRPGEEIRRICALIRPGGFLFVMTEFHQGLNHFAKWHYPRDPTHVAFYGPRTLDCIARTFGLTLQFSDGRNTAGFRRTDG